MIAQFAGLQSVLLGSTVDYNYKLEPEPVLCKQYSNQSCPYYKGKTLGGNSAINNMIYVRGSKEDYNQWEYNGNKGWSWEYVFPYFKKSEHFRNPEVSAIININSQ